MSRSFIVAVLAMTQCCQAQTQDARALRKQCSDVQANPKLTYSIGQKSHDPSGVLELQIATSSENTEGEPIIQLACKLSEDFLKDRMIVAWIFNDKSAARNIALGLEDQKNHGEYLWHLRGYYERDRDKKSEYVEYVVPVYQDNLLQLERAKIILSR